MIIPVVPKLIILYVNDYLIVICTSAVSIMRLYTATGTAELSLLTDEYCISFLAAFSVALEDGVL